MSEFKAIIFDFGGVISMPRGLKEIILHLAGKFGVEEKAFEVEFRALWDKAKVGEFDEGEMLERLFKKFNISYDVEKAKKEWFSLNSLVPEMIELVNVLKRREFKLAILSNNSRQWFEFRKRLWHFEELFDEIIVSYEIKAAKPDSAPYLIAAEKLGVKPEDCIFVDDQQKNIEGAEAVGMKGILFFDAKQLKHDLAELGIKV